MIGYVYKVTLDKSPSYYIGSTENIHARLLAHRSELRCGQHGSFRFQQAWDESGSTLASIEILFTGTIEEAEQKELELLRLYSGDSNLKNTCVTSRKGVSIDRLRNPAETRAKLSAATSGSNNPMFGKTHSEEARRKISEAHKGKPGHNLGKTLSDITKQRISEAKKKNPLTGERNPFYGKKHSPEIMERIKQANIGKPSLSAKRIQVGTVIYRTQLEAANALGVSAALITYRLSKPDKYPEYQSLHNG